MPPATRRSSGPSAKGSQKTLTFNNSKITKPSPAPSSLKKAVSPTEKSTVAITIPPPDAVADLDVGHTSTTTAAVQQQAQTELARLSRSPEEERAAKVTDAQVRKYWKAREAERKAPRVHQEGLSVEERVLRYFDISSQYGPCVGIARMKRWVRANKLGLNPPIEVLAVLLKEEGRGNAGIERAYVDELMSSKFED